MATYVGVDWAATGWFGVALSDDGTHEVDLYPSMLSVWHAHRDAETILVDVPIGLRESGRREVDRRAKEVLSGARSHSVFSTPVREAVYAPTLAAAKEINEARAGVSVQNQAWRLCPRIREVDEFLTEFPEAIGTVRETHPEVCFWSLNGGNSLRHSKHVDRGVTKRLRLIESYDDGARAVYDAAVETFIEPPTYARRLGKGDRDDVLDALVAAVTARRFAGEYSTLPDDPETVEIGGAAQPMEIVYPPVVRQSHLDELGTDDG